MTLPDNDEAVIRGNGEEAGMEWAMSEGSNLGTSDARWPMPAARAPWQVAQHLPAATELRDVGSQTEPAAATVTTEGTTMDSYVCVRAVASQATHSLVTGRRMISMESQCSPPRPPQKPTPLCQLASSSMPLTVHLRLRPLLPLLLPVALPVAGRRAWK